MTADRIFTLVVPVTKEVMDWLAVESDPDETIEEAAARILEGQAATEFSR